MSGFARLFASVVDYAIEEGEDAPKAMLRILITRLGPDLVRGELDQYAAGRAIADMAEEVKFGPAK